VKNAKIIPRENYQPYGNTHSGCVTQDPRVGTSEACAIHPTHPVYLVACTSES